MSQLKEQNGRYYQECQVVMIATNQKSRIILSANKLMLSPHLNTVWQDTSGKCQHLYFLSDDEIKENDWCLHNNGEIYQNSYGTLGSVIGKPEYIKENCKKIIATTDESLGLPKPSDSFIRKYIEEYNAGRQITDVLVEYECNGGRAGDYEMIPKIDSDNIITTTKLKDSYSREEVIKLLNSAMIAAGNHGKRIQVCYMTDIGEPPLTPESFTNQWIEDNL